MKNSEFILFLERLKTEPKGWLLQFSLSNLISSLDSSRLKSIMSGFLVFEKEKLCKVFTHQHDVYFYFPETKTDDMQALIIKLKFMIGFSVFQKIKENNLLTIYHMTTDLPYVLRLLERKTVKAEQIQKQQPSVNTSLSEMTHKTPFTPALLEQMESSLTNTDLSHLTKHQPVCAVVGRSPPLEVFSEIYVSLADLKKALCPQVDLFSAPWLLSRLLASLDICVLNNMAHHDSDAFKQNISINLTVKSILSDAFARFDASLSQTTKETILLELQLMDIFNDTESYLAARAFAMSKGYRICVDGVTVDSLPFLNLDAIGGSFIKLIWHPELIAKAKDENFARLIRQHNPNRIILCRVDDKNAIEVGHSLGISLFQGYYIQKTMFQNPKLQKNY